MRLLALVLASVVLTAAPRAQEAGPSSGCDVGDAPLALARTLPLGVLDYLQTQQQSPMVHAFLVDHIGRYGRAGHPMQACAVAFRAAPLHALDTLRAHHLDVSEMLAALRTAERQRIDFLTLQKSERTTSKELARVIRSRLAERGHPADSLALLFDQVAYARSINCPDAAAITFCEATAAVAESRAPLEAAERERDEREGALRVDLGNAELALREVQSRLLALEPVPPDNEGEAAAEALRDSLDGVRNRLVERRLQLQGGLADLDSSVVQTRRRAVEAAEALVGAPEPAREPQAEQAVPDLRLGQGIRVAPDEPARLQPTPAAAAPDVLAGLADFVIDRARDELVLGLIVQIRTWLAEGDPATIALAQRAFPDTWQLMRSLAPEARFTILDAGSVPLTVWRATLRADIETLPTHVFDAAEAVCAVAENEPTCRLQVQQVHLAAHAGFRLLDGDPAFEVLAGLPLSGLRDLAADRPEVQQLFAALRVVQLLAQGYRVQGVAVLPDTGLPPPFALSEVSIRRASREVQDLLLRHLIVEMASAEAAWPWLDATVSSERLMTSLLDTAGELDRLGAVLRSDDGASARLAAATDAAGRVVASALDLASAFGMSPDATLEARWRTVSALVEASGQRDYALVLARTAALLAEARGEPLPPRVLTLAGLGVALAEAQTEAQVRAAFSAVAAPVGGWQAKRYRTGPRLSLTAYPGAGVAHEWIVPAPDAAAAGVSAGVSLPIGVEVRVGRDSPRGTPGGCLNLYLARPCSVGVFASVLDLGTYLSYRLSGTDGVDSAPNASLRQVFAPGLAVAVGLGRTPVSLLLGGQFVPELRRLDGDDAGRGALRLTAGVAVDAVLLTF